MNTNRFTENKLVPVTIYVFAIPRNEWELSQAEKDGDRSPFKYVARSYDNAYEEGATLVHQISIDVAVPEGIDLFEKTLETLRNEQKKAQQDADEKIARCEEQIKQLLLLTDQRPYQRDDETVVAVQ